MSVITTSAPPLPVRGEHTRHAVSPMLHRLAAERATGVLLRESGSLYLSDGEVVHAESPRSPGLDVLLSAGGVLDTDGWREAVDTAGAGLRVGRFLVDSGRVTKGALELCHAGAMFDAAYFVLGPSSAPARFRYGAAHWLGPIRPVPVATITREALRRRDLLHRIWPDAAADDAPLMRAVGLSSPPVPIRQGAVLDQINGFRTAADISLTLGRPTFHTLVAVRRLAAAGLISPAPPHPPRTPPAPDTTPGRTAPAPDTPQGPSAPTRATVPYATPYAAPHPGSYGAPDGPAGGSPAGTATAPGTLPPEPADVPGSTPPHPVPVPAPPWPLVTADPDIALLQRLRDALEAL
ncbi:DUF4388 domain-containing protein [Streptomyces neyagawaensis]|uniref:DUF4388 domain-containing protein n=2 Tax=Streptomyces neyagawaensis TaxID=42238 RepID=UPI00201D1BFB|nr:DUF4388 domain-containing protein [Streptomyces neyagawaensis]MCL6733116.1 hypothetical protein [Streptomyces neyagawaensis]MDE1687618.1 hypothetical protein [Streptomyces neyagawaensis]